ncbi:MAG: queuosine precursor transporter, partial [Neisseriaceae bacterium]|nr:queuosine precursor transporter [Neisseriaceae bacterium]
FVGRIALASFLAYLLGQCLDISVFSRLRQLKAWWVAPTAAIFVGNALDTAIFFSVAFYQSSDAFMAANWVNLALVDYGIKLVFSLAVFIPLYGVLLNYLSRKLLQIGFQIDTNGLVNPVLH